MGKACGDMRPGSSSKSIVNKNIKDEIYLLFYGIARVDR